MQKILKIPCLLGEDEVTDTELVQCLDFLENSMDIFPDTSGEWEINMTDSQFKRLVDDVNQTPDNLVSIFLYTILANILIVLLFS